MAAAVLVEGTFHSLAGNLCILCGIVHGASHAALSPLTEAAAAGVTGVLCVIALHLNIVLTAAFLLVVHTSGYGTI